jgi:hypothetical protein
VNERKKKQPLLPRAWLRYEARASRRKEEVSHRVAHAEKSADGRKLQIRYLRADLE